VIEGIIFDFDGVLVESEFAGNEQIARTLTDLGWPTTVDQALDRFVGHGGRDFVPASARCPQRCRARSPRRRPAGGSVRISIISGCATPSSRTSIRGASMSRAASPPQTSISTPPRRSACRSNAR
jgi:hypothetical protein